MGTQEQRFFDLFGGHTGAHGQTSVLDTKRRGKQEADYIIIREPLTVELVREHLDGKRGIGSIPIDEANMCSFGAIDIDDYDLDLAALYSKISRLKLPLITCRSKSGGAHLFIFMSEKIAASEMRDKLSEFAAALGWGTCEIFPKQEILKTNRGDVGSFINLPYFGEYTTRYALSKNNSSLSLDEFLDKAEKARISLKQLASISVGGDGTVLPQGPPCLQQITELGIPEGGRNQTLLNVGIYYKMVDSENWKELLEKHNQEHCIPSLPAKEIVMIQEQLEKKDYYYTCKQEPLHSHCNKVLCKTRRYGIGNGETAPTLSGLTVVESEPPVWFLDVNGMRLELSTKQLQIQQEFQRACMEQIYKMPARIKDSDWRDQIDVMLESATRISVPEELTQKGQFMELLEQFCAGRFQAHSPEELITGKPWTEDGITYFKLGALQEFLKRNNFLVYTRGQITERLKELNSGKISDKRYSFTDDQSKQRVVRVWFVPEMKRGDVELPEVTFEPEDVPF
jgi:hypothetical protein